MKPFLHRHSGVAFCNYNPRLDRASFCSRYNVHQPDYASLYTVKSQRYQRLHFIESSPSSSDFDNNDIPNSAKSGNLENNNNNENNSEDDEKLTYPQQHQHLQHNDDDFLNFDDEDLLEELIQFSSPNDLIGPNDDHDEDPNFMDFDNELKELERFIDEQTNMNRTGDEVIDFGDDDIAGANTSIMKNTPSTASVNQSFSSSLLSNSSPSTTSSPLSSALEEALLQGVVPAAAGVGSNCLPGDYGFDPLGFSKKDYFKQVQKIFLNLLPSPQEEGRKQSIDDDENGGGAALPLSTKPTSRPLYDDSKRPTALILRDYREAEIRHGRLAMLAAILWPLQEIIDRLFIPASFGHTTFVYGGPTLPFVSLFMTLVMLLLGYLDIYAASIKDVESGDAFLPGECFWDPLSILDGAPDPMKRKMQERELNNGRMAMIAVLSYILQEGITHEPVINLPWNQVLFEPAFEIPEVQAWLDIQFGGASTISDEAVLNSVRLNDLELVLDDFDPTIQEDFSIDISK